MLQKPTNGRLLTALRLAFYPAFESAEARRFQALTMEAENARGAGDLAKAEKVYSTAAAEARSSSDPSHLSRARDGLARVYQEWRRYREAERIFQDQLEAAVNSPQPNTLVRAGHMSLALLYQDEGITWSIRVLSNGYYTPLEQLVCKVTCYVNWRRTASMQRDFGDRSYGREVCLHEAAQAIRPGRVNDSA